MNYSNNSNFFLNFTSEIKAFISDFENFNTLVIKNVEIFQDDLLLNIIEFLLSVPTNILKIIYVNNIKTLNYIFKRAFEIGYNDYRYCKLALNALKSYMNEEKEKGTVSEIVKEILPLFGDYLVEYQKIKESLKKTNNNELYDKFHTIQNEILKILGDLGGEAHLIIKEAETKKTCSILNIVNTQNIEYNLPLFNKKYVLYFDHLIIT